MTRYFITGAQGFVGRHLVTQLLATKADAEILGSGRSAENRGCFTHQVSWGSRCLAAPLPRSMQIAHDDQRYRYLPLDLADVEETSRELRRFRPEVVIHLASALRGDSSLTQFRTNAEGSLQLLAALEHADVKPDRIVFGSTGGVYGLPAVGELPLREGSPCQPADIYGVSKLAAEQATRLEVQRLKWPAVWARLFNIVGIGQDERHVCGRLVSQAAAISRSTRAVIPPSNPKRQRGRSLQETSNSLSGEASALADASGYCAAPRIEVGGLESTRDFIDVHDVARALIFLTHHEQPHEIVNVASGRETSIGEVLRLTLSHCGLNGQVEIVLSAIRGEVTRHVADVSRLNGLGFVCEIGLEQSLDELIQYYLQEVASQHEESEPEGVSRDYS